ncbi:MAG: hypothetical protein ACI9ZH_002282 [Paracoccaceae bacterium]|jgi:hypothetical protein
MTSAVAPIFVFGALRSGTTMFRLMLDAHAQIANPGEFDFIARFLQRGADGAWTYDREALALDRVFVHRGFEAPSHLDGAALLDCFIDQIRAMSAPGVFTINLHDGFDKLAALHPDLRVIHVLRDPRDVASSSLAMGWAGTLWHAVGHWIETETQWGRAEALIAPENRLELRYEDLLRDLEGQLGRVCDFMGVDLSEAMLNYDRTSSYGRPNPKLIEQWRRKLSPRDLGLIEGRIGPLLAARGYAPSGAPLIAPEGMARRRLALENAVGRLRFDIDRFGLGLAAADRATRALGLKGPFKAVRARMNAISQDHVK